MNDHFDSEEAAMKEGSMTSTTLISPAFPEIKLVSLLFLMNTKKRVLSVLRGLTLIFSEMQWVCCVYRLCYTILS